MQVGDLFVFYEIQLNRKVRGSSILYIKEVTSEKSSQHFCKVVDCPKKTVEKVSLNWIEMDMKC